ncbi:MAG: DUF1292 domain-containing protein [Bacilli bacterium]|nr:DUF1292 domain-containing protein [Bacilli bacterium]
MNKKISAILKNGEKKEYDVILTFKNDKNNKNYIVYTDNKIDNENKLKIYASIYNPLTNEFVGIVESKEEWYDIYRLLDKVMLNN